MQSPEISLLIALARTAARQPKCLHIRLFEAKLNNVVKQILVDQFWSHFPENFEKGKTDSHRPFIDAVKFLRETIASLEKSLVQSGEPNLKEKLSLAFKTQISSSKPYYLNDYIEATYTKAFQAFQEDINKESQALFKEFCDINRILQELDLLDIFVNDTVMKVARASIAQKVAYEGKSNYSFSYLDALSGWVDDIVKLWFHGIYGNSDQTKLAEISTELDQFLRCAYAEVRVSHMFEIIIEYPNSEAAIQDLKSCLEQSSASFRLNLIRCVQQSLVESLLHPGVNTYDILTAYISAIKALRALDPSGLILQLVTEPVRRYLKLRNDTVRCIVTALTDEDQNSDLNREMIRGTQTNENGLTGKSGTIEVNLPNEGEKCTALNFEKWRPDPIELSSTDDVMKTSRFSDIVSILVNIYETKDLFVEEYQKLLSQRLLNKYDECNLDTELRNLELLTLRFSDCELHRCEVMLKDVHTSKRVNKRVLAGDIKDHKLIGFEELDVLIVSSPFWPEKFGPIAALSDETPKINFPIEIQSAIDTYTKAFEAIQASRTLHWRHHLGSVNMDVTINGKSQNFRVSPLHASLLYMFQTRKVWKLEEIIRETSLTAATVRSRLALWQRNGIIKDCGEDKFELICE